MTEPRNLTLLATLQCAAYRCEAKIYIQDKHPSGLRHLVAQYGEGYNGPHLPKGKDGHHEFLAAIPSSISDQAIIDEWLLLPMKAEAPYPKWEIPARIYGSPTLFRWWAGEKPD